MASNPAQALFDELSGLDRAGALDREAFVRLGAQIVATVEDRDAAVKADILESLRTYAPDELAWPALQTALRERGLLAS